jgi:hypothetical protein
LLPSVAWYEPRGHALVGHAARQQIVDEPTNTVVGFKRLLGRRLSSQFVCRRKESFAYKLIGSWILRGDRRHQSRAPSSVPWALETSEPPADGRRLVGWVVVVVGLATAVVAVLVGVWQRFG